MIYQTWSKTDGIQWAYSCGCCPFRIVEPKKQRAVTAGDQHAKANHPNRLAEELKEIIDE